MSTSASETAGLPIRGFKWPHSRLFVYAAILVGLVLLLQQMLASQIAVDESWFMINHTTSAALGLVIGMLCMAYYRSFGARSLLFFSFGFIGTAAIDVLHVIQMVDQGRQFLPDVHGGPGSWNSMAARLHLAIMLLAGWRASEGRISQVSKHTLRNGTVALLSVGLWCLLFGVALVLPQVPQFSTGPTLPHLAAGVIGALFCATLGIFLARGDWKRFRTQHLFVVALLILVAGEWVFIPLAQLPWGNVMLAAELLRMLSYVLIFTALFSSMPNLFEQASDVLLERRINATMSRLGAGRAVAGSQPTADVQRFTHVGTWELDLVTGGFAFNRATKALFGADANIDNVRAFHDMVHPDDRARLREALIRSEAEGELFRQEYRILLRGEYRWIESIGGIEFVNGKPTRLLGYNDDITGRKLVEQEMESIVHDLDRMVTAVDHHALTATLDTGGRILSTNSIFDEFCGAETDTLIGRRFDEIVTLVPERAASGAGEATAWTGQISLDHPTGRIRTAAGSITLHRHEDDATNSAIFLGVDITERIEAEMALNASNEAHRSSNKDLQMFAHIVSHDLQEPMRMVTSFMTLLDRRHGDQLKGEAREYMQYVVEGVNRMGSLLDGLLQYSRVQSGGLNFEEVGLEQPLQDALDNLSVLLRDSGATVDMGSLPALNCDRSQMMQLFQNLLSNAIKFRRADPLVVRIGSRQVDGRWVVDVEDNGIGFEDKHNERIFQIFQRLHSRDAYPGTGVGLAICSRIMQRHGGHIEVDSKPGEGSRFSLCF